MTYFNTSLPIGRLFYSFPTNGLVNHVVAVDLADCFGGIIVIVGVNWLIQKTIITVYTCCASG